jgi:hypothetical protein
MFTRQWRGVLLARGTAPGMYLDPFSVLNGRWVPAPIQDAQQNLEKTQGVALG